MVKNARLAQHSGKLTRSHPCPWHSTLVNWPDRTRQAESDRYTSSICILSMVKCFAVCKKEQNLLEPATGCNVVKHTSDHLQNSSQRTANVCYNAILHTGGHCKCTNAHIALHTPHYPADHCNDTHIKCNTKYIAAMHTHQPPPFFHPSLTALRGHCTGPLHVKTFENIKFRQCSGPSSSPSSSPSWSPCPRKKQPPGSQVRPRRSILIFSLQPPVYSGIMIMIITILKHDVGHKSEAIVASHKSCQPNMPRDAPELPTAHHLLQLAPMDMNIEIAPQTLHQKYCSSKVLPEILHLKSGGLKYCTKIIPCGLFSGGCIRFFLSHKLHTCWLKSR